MFSRVDQLTSVRAQLVSELGLAALPALDEVAAALLAPSP